MATTKEAPKEPKRSGKLKIIVIILVLLLLLIGGSVVFWWFQLRQPGASASVVPSTQTSAQNGATTSTVVPGETSASNRPATDMPRPVTNIVPLPSVMVNLADAAENRYLKVGMEVEVSAPEAVQEIQSQSARIRDAIIILLSSKTYTELASAEGKMQLKNEVASRLNQILGTPRVVRIYFTEFVVQ